MDNLAKNAMLAREAEMSYGRWKALQYQQQKQETQPEPKGEIPEGWVPCEWCKKLFKPKTKHQRFCESYCQQQSFYSRNHERELEKMRLYREKRKAASGGK